MPTLKEIEQSLNHLFEIEKYGKDSAFSRFIPAVYDPIPFPWQNFLKPILLSYLTAL
ncbi:hypothetical protein G5716_27500 [Bacillus pacificus]|nr:hypothetical protein [Bacillus pacificus]